MPVGVWKLTRRLLRLAQRVQRALHEYLEDLSCASLRANLRARISNEEAPFVRRLSDLVEVPTQSVSPLTSSTPDQTQPATEDNRTDTDREEGSTSSSSSSRPSSPPPPPPAPSSPSPSDLQNQPGPALPIQSDREHAQEGLEDGASASPLPLITYTAPSPCHLDAQETGNGAGDQEDKTNAIPPPHSSGPDTEASSLPSTTPSPPANEPDAENKPEVEDKEDEPPLLNTTTTVPICSSEATVAAGRDIAATVLPSNGKPSPLSVRRIPKGERMERGAFEIDIVQGFFGLGLKVGTNESGMIVVKALSSRSPITKNGNIKVGDILLAVNGISLTNETTETAKAILKSMPCPGVVRFVVMAPPHDVTGEGLPASVMTTIGKSASNRELILTEGIVTAVVCCSEDHPIGFEIEGGLDTPLKYIYLKSLIPNSPAWSRGAFREGDQLVMVGDECLVGLTADEARRVLERACGDVEVVAQRKESPRQIPMHTASITEMDLPFRLQSSSDSALSLGITTRRCHSGTSSMHDLGTPLNSAQESHPSGIDLRLMRQYLAEQERAASLVPIETHTIDLKISPNQRLGLVLAGGADNPNLKEPHVRKVLEDGIAQKDGRLKCGDRIVSVNGHSLSGMDHKKAVLVLREAGEGGSATLVITRKIGRRNSLARAPIATPGSDHLSRRCSQTGERTRKSPGTTTASPGASRCSSPPRACAATDHIRRISSMASSMGTVGVKVVELTKGPDGLGLKLMGGKDTSDPVMVKVLTWRGPAHQSGRVHRGDIIIEANGVSFEDLTYEQAVKTMDEFPQGKVKMLMRDRAAMAVALHHARSASS